MPKANVALYGLGRIQPAQGGDVRLYIRNGQRWFLSLYGAAGEVDLGLAARAKMFLVKLV
jgi:hypothetical protein